MTSFSCLCVKRPNGRLDLLDEPGYRAFVETLGEGQEIAVDFSEATLGIPKTRKQESAFHAMIAPWAKEEGHRVDDLKRDLLRAVFGEQEHLDPITGNVTMVLREPHTSTLNKKQYSELIERTLQIGAECGFVLIAPDEWRRQRDMLRPEFDILNPTVAVARAAARLDAIRPGWANEIDEGLLNLSSCTECVLGQVFGTFPHGLEALGYRDRYGDYDITRLLYDVGDAFGDRIHEDAWIAAIADRRLAVQTETEVAAPVAARVIA